MNIAFRNIFGGDCITIKQRQCLLAYLGYYAGGVDGVWGPLSEAAVRRFQRACGLTEDGAFGPETEARIRQVIGNGEEPAAEGNAFWNRIRYWNREEFRCRCGGKYCDGFPAEPDEALVELADDVRAHFGRPGHRSSGLRCRTWNAIQGGVADSRHLTGKALDFCIEGNTAAQTLAYIRTLRGVRYAYDIDGTYVHMDVA